MKQLGSNGLRSRAGETHPEARRHGSHSSSGYERSSRPCRARAWAKTMKLLISKAVSCSSPSEGHAVSRVTLRSFICAVFCRVSQ